MKFYITKILLTNLTDVMTARRSDDSLNEITRFNVKRVLAG